MQHNYDEIDFSVEPGKPIKLIQQVSNSDQESVKTGGFIGGMNKGFSKEGASSVVSRTACSLVGYNPVQMHILDKNCEYICRWFT